MTAFGFLHRKAKSLIGGIAALAVLAGIVSTASAQAPKDYLRYRFTQTTDLTATGGVKDTGTGKSDGTELSGGTEAFIVPGHTAGSFACYLAGTGTNTGIDTGIDTGTAGIATGPFTALAWVYRGSAKGDNMLFGTNLNGAGDLHLGFRNAFFHCGFWGNDSEGPVVPLFQWHHWALRYDDSLQTQDMFVDGVLVSSSGGHGPYGGTNELFIGITYGNGGAYSGAIDDARLFQVALRNDQIAAIAADQVIPP
jgi:hypothetical protein